MNKIKVFIFVFLFIFFLRFCSVKSAYADLSTCNACFCPNSCQLLKQNTNAKDYCSMADEPDMEADPSLRFKVRVFSAIDQKVQLNINCTDTSGGIHTLPKPEDGLLENKEADFTNPATCSSGQCFMRVSKAFSCFTNKDLECSLTAYYISADGNPGNTVCSKNFNIGDATTTAPQPTIRLINPECTAQFGKFTGVTNRGVNTALGCIPTYPSGFTLWVLYFFLPIAGGIAFFLLLGGSITLMTTSGDPEKIAQAQQIIMATIAGLLFIIFSVYLLNLMGAQIFKIPGF